MKTITNSCTILLLLLLCRCANDSASCSYREGTLHATDGLCFPKVEDAYTYPVAPGMEEWQTSGDVFELVQLPGHVLNTISTLGLIDALVQSPLFAGYYQPSGSTPIATWHRHYGRFNCATELFRRDDAGKALITYYRSIRMNCIESSAAEENPGQLGAYERVFGLEFLFTRQEILNKIGHVDKQALVDALLATYERQPERWMKLIPMSFIMMNDQYPPMEKYYLENIDLYERSIAFGYIVSIKQSDQILSLANRFITKK
ncbi:MAG: hypothetical protein LBS05_10920 [Tannerellaceae bacterium]|jgi:hypothetical protein|nr:hypothetical protein [Tannerellaceae bacterium]